LCVCPLICFRDNGLLSESVHLTLILGPRGGDLEQNISAALQAHILPVLVHSLYTVQPVINNAPVLIQFGALLSSIFVEKNKNRVIENSTKILIFKL
jgi:hypothetical protein